MYSNSNALCVNSYDSRECVFNGKQVLLQCMLREEFKNLWFIFILIIIRNLKAFKSLSFVSVHAARIISKRFGKIASFALKW
jgi:hypothetical protein